MDNVKLVLEGGVKAYFRFSNEYAEKVKPYLIRQYSNDGEIEVAMASSGMNAITTTMLVIMSKWGWSNDCCILLGDEMYGDTPRAAKHHSSIFTGNNLGVYKVDVSDNSKVINIFKDKFKNKKVLFMMEPCTNPNGNIFDFSIVNELRGLCKNLLLVADITWTPQFNALEYGADALVISLTKHHSGSSCILGAVISRNQPAIAYEVNQYLRLSGSHISPYDSSKLLSMMSTYDERIENAHNTAIKVAKELIKKKWVVKVNFPLLKSHNSNRLAVEYNMKPTVMNILMEIPGSRRDVEKWIKSRKNLTYATSYGGKDSRIDPWYKRIEGTSKYWIRISIGYESSCEDVIESLEDF